MKRQFHENVYTKEHLSTASLSKKLGECCESFWRDQLNKKKKGSVCVPEQNVGLPVHSFEEHLC